MLTKFSIITINLYQRCISPHKGYTSEYSCSQFAKIAIQENGLFSAFPLIKKQFDKCSFTAEEIKRVEKSQKKQKKINL